MEVSETGLPLRLVGIVYGGCVWKALGYRFNRREKILAGPECGQGNGRFDQAQPRKRRGRRTTPRPGYCPNGSSSPATGAVPVAVVPAECPGNALT